ncbi:unnamed protein product [Urochloa decumbens]|uniref:Ubiquitin-like protease family profile domain-containing protein n=1 Tax=Urochloa decumbens TaxID=240449 RepID=A0ABC9C158_9POAL
MVRGTPPRSRAPVQEEARSVRVTRSTVRGGRRGRGRATDGRPPKSGGAEVGSSSEGLEAAASAGDESGMAIWENKDAMNFYPGRFFGHFSTEAVSSLVATFGEKKLSIVRSIGLSGVIHLKERITHHKNLVYYLLKRIDTEKMRIVLGGGETLDLSVASVERVLGVRSTGVELVDDEDSNSTMIKSKLCRAFGIDGVDVLPGLADIQKVLLKDYPDDMSKEDEDKFIVTFAAFCIAHIFGNKDRGASVPAKVWKFISNADNVRRCNWASFVLRCVKKAAMDVQDNLRSKNPTTTVRLAGCWLYLELLYLDSVDLGEFNAPSEVTPRVLAYTDLSISELCDMDQISKVLFGKLERWYVKGRGRQTGSASGYSGASTQFPGMAPGNLPDYSALVHHIEAEHAKYMDHLTTVAMAVQQETQVQYELQCKRISDIFDGLKTAAQHHKARLVSLVVGQHTSASNARTDEEQEKDAAAAEQSDTELETGVDAGDGGYGTPNTGSGTEAGQTSFEPGINNADKEVDARRDGCNTSKAGGIDGGGKGPFETAMQEDRGDGTQNAKGDVENSQTPLNAEGDTKDSTEPSINEADGSMHKNSAKNGSDVPQPSCTFEQRAADEAVHDEQSEGVGAATSDGATFDKTPEGRTDGTPHRFAAFDKTPVGADDAGVDAPVFDKTPGFDFASAGQAGRRYKIGARKRKCAPDGAPRCGVRIKLCTTRRPCQSEATFEEEGRETSEEYSVGGGTCEDEIDLKGLRPPKVTPPARVWLSHDVPVHVEITGVSFQGQLVDGDGISAELMTAYVRLMQQRDSAAYRTKGNLAMKWRHLMEPAFAEKAMLGEDFDVDDHVRELMIGAHLGGFIAEAAMIMVPTNALGSWCLYVFDMIRRRINVLDPMRNDKKYHEMWQIHLPVIQNVLDAISISAQEYLTDWEDNFENFSIDSVRVWHEMSTSEDSGVYVMHYMKWFDGDTVSRIIDQDEFRKLKQSIVYDVLTMAGNNGELPDGLVDMVDLSD